MPVALQRAFQLGVIRRASVPRASSENCRYAVARGGALSNHRARPATRRAVSIAARPLRVSAAVKGRRERTHVRFHAARHIRRRRSSPTPRPIRARPTCEEVRLCELRQTSGPARIVLGSAREGAARQRRPVARRGGSEDGRCRRNSDRRHRTRWRTGMRHCAAHRRLEDRRSVTREKNGRRRRFVPVPYPSSAGRGARQGLPAPHCPCSPAWEL